MSEVYQMKLADETNDADEQISVVKVEIV